MHIQFRQNYCYIRIIRSCQFISITYVQFDPLHLLLHCGSEQPCIARPFACSLALLTCSLALLTLLARSAALTRSLARSLTPSLVTVNDWMAIYSAFFPLQRGLLACPFRRPLKKRQRTNIQFPAESRPRTMVQNSQLSQHLIIYFLKSSGVSKGAVRANKQIDKPVAQY